jgi:hypothetical protein
MSVYSRPSPLRIHLRIVDASQVIKCDLTISVENQHRQQQILVKIFDQQIKALSVALGVKREHRQSGSSVLGVNKFVDLEVVQRFVLGRFNKLN